MSESGLLYMFTTIAQCLATGAALLTAFALYRLQGIEGGKLSVAHSLLAILNEPISSALYGTLNAFLSERNYSAFVGNHARMLQETKGADPPIASRLRQENCSVRLTNLMAEEAKLREALWLVISASGLVIITSVGVLPFAKELTDCPLPTDVSMCTVAPWGIAAGGFAAFVFCLWLFYKLIRVTLAR